MVGLKNKIKQVLLSKLVISSEVQTRVYYFGEVVNTHKVIAITRDMTPDVFDDTIKLLVRPTIFIRVETENKDTFSDIAKRDFFVTYLLNTSENVLATVRSALTELSGNGNVYEILHVSTSTDNYDNTLGTSVDVVRFLCTYNEGSYIL